MAQCRLVNVTDASLVITVLLLHYFHAIIIFIAVNDWKHCTDGLSFFN